jgi:predicted nuclease of restriction endonuclease-like RecB superfamily
MLTRKLAIVEYKNGQAFPDRLFRKQHARYLDLAAQMLNVYRLGIHQMRRHLHQEVHAIFARELDCPPQRIDAFCKLLDDASDYRGIPSSQAAKLRIEVFRQAAKLHPLVDVADRWFENQEQVAKQVIASELGQSWSSIELRLFGDLIEFHRLEKFNDFVSPAALLARYNVAQTQVALFDAQKMRVVATDDFKSILRFAKLARLMHTIEREQTGVYRFDLDGPSSLLQSTHRYGVAMARFLPGLLSCRGWKLWALLKPSHWHGHVTLTLSPRSGLSSPVVASDEFDSNVESEFAAKWGTEPRDGWTLERETEILHAGQKVFVPDFVFRHSDGRQVLMEVVGYWTPEYLQQKLETLHAFRKHSIMLVVANSNRQHFETNNQPVVFYKTVIKIEMILDHLKLL